MFEKLKKGQKELASWQSEHNKLYYTILHTEHLRIKTLVKDMQESSKKAFQNSVHLVESITSKKVLFVAKQSKVLEEWIKSSENNNVKGISIMSKEDNQTKFWKIFIRGITENAATQTDPKSVIAVDADVACSMGESDDKAYAQIYEMANSIIPWSLTWTGSPQGDWFRMYQSFIQSLSAKKKNNADPALFKKLNNISQKIVNFNSKTNALLHQSIQIYMKDYCLEAGKNSAFCKTPLPGAPTLINFIQSYQKSSDYKQKVKALEQEYSSSLSGLQDQYDSIAEQYYGSNYKQIREAKDAVNYADPNNMSQLDSVANFRMSVSQGDHSVRMVPRYISSNLENYKKWLMITQQAFNDGKTPNIKIEFSNKINEKSQFTSSYSANAIIPVSTFFQVMLSSSGKYQKIDMDKTSFNMVVSYQDVFQISISPAQSWYFANMLKEYRDFYASDVNSPFHNKELWGKKGIFNIQIVGIIVGYGAYLKLESAKWHQSDMGAQFKESASYGVGPIHFISEEAGFNDKNHKVTQLNDGIEVQDQSGIPKIIAVITNNPNV